MVKFGGISGEQLKQIVARIEKLEEEKKEISEFISDSYKEAKSNGFDVKVLRKIVALRKRDRQQVEEEEEIMDLYKHALGMIALAGKDDEDTDISEDEGEEEASAGKSSRKAA